MSNTKINPEPYVFDMSKGMAAVRAHQQFMTDNKHLALQFPIPELRYYFHPSYPGKQTTVQAQSHNGKSLFTDFWAHQAAKELFESGRRGVIVKVNTEDAIETLITAELSRGGAGKLDDLQAGIIANSDEYLKVETQIGSLPIVHIGESLGMDDSVAAELHLSNIARLIDFTRKEYFSEEMPIVAIFVDFIQALPLDPEIKTTIENTRRIQVISDENRLRRAAKYFYCPVIVAAQSKQDADMSTAHSFLRLPGFWDVQEASYVAQHTDFMYSLWFPKTHYQLGSTQDDRSFKWSLNVKDDQLWIKALKHKGYKNIGAAFPLLVDEWGNIKQDQKTLDYIQKTERNNND